jgi:hypothetical protein
VLCALTTSHTLLSGAKCSGTTTRLRQLDADHQSEPLTARSETTDWDATSPGLNCPEAVHSSSAFVASSPGAGRSFADMCSPSSSQLIPLIGMTTSEHATCWLQPSEAFCSAVQTSNEARPRPLLRVTPKVSLLGTSCVSPLLASGGSPAQPSRPGPPPKTCPFAALNGTQRSAADGSPQSADRCRGAPTTAARCAAGA